MITIHLVHYHMMHRTMHYYTQPTDNEANHALDKVLIGALLTLNHQCVNIEHTDVILHYTPTISIKNYNFYQMVIDAPNYYQHLGAL